MAWLKRYVELVHKKRLDSAHSVAWCGGPGRWRAPRASHSRIGRVLPVAGTAGVPSHDLAHMITDSFLFGAPKRTIEASRCTTISSPNCRRSGGIGTQSVSSRDIGFGIFRSSKRSFEIMATCSLPTRCQTAAGVWSSRSRSGNAHESQLV
jgi:hypothetical protein